jgi:chloride channel protein, CIC family
MSSSDRASDRAPAVTPVTPPVAQAQLEEEIAPAGLVRLSLLALVVGLMTGFGAVFFRDLIGLVHNAAFLGQLDYHYDARIFTPASRWGALIILVPVAGSLVLTFLINNFAPEARGHGVPEVMDAIYYQRGVIRPVVALVKSLASALAIGTGAAVGREGPIIQIGSALGSTLGQLIRIPAGQRIILVAAGSGAGIAATFNTPIGGVMFAIELMMPEVSARTFLPVAIATGVATFIGRFFFGPQPAFTVPALAPLSVDTSSAILLCMYAALGVVVGLAATAFVRGLSLLEDSFARVPNRYLRHALGMALVGMLMYGLFRAFGHYFVEGVGYSTIQAILLGHLSAGGLLLILFGGKLLATTLSLGSGSSGGIFSPSLFMGATIGSVFAAVLSELHLPFALDLPSFAMVGMGAMVGGATGAVMTAVTMIFEMTRDYDIVLPMILAVAFSVGVRRLLSPESIYTLKIYRRGHVLPKSLHANMFLVRRARDVMDADVALAPADMSVAAFFALPEQRGRLRNAVVFDGERMFGVLPVNTPLVQASHVAENPPTLRDVASNNYTVVRGDDIMFDVIRRMWRMHATMAVVVRTSGAPAARDVLGVITKEQVADSVAGSVNVYASGD